MHLSSWAKGLKHLTIRVKFSYISLPPPPLLGEEMCCLRQFLSGGFSVLSACMLKKKRYLECGLIWACLAKRLDFWWKGLIAYKQNSGNGFVEHKERHGLLDMESTGPSNTAAAESRAMLWLHAYPSRSHPFKSSVRPSPHTHTHVRDLPVPIWHLWSVLKVLPRASLQQQALIGGSDRKMGGKTAKWDRAFCELLQVLVTSTDWEAERKSQRKLRLEEGRGDKEQRSRENIWE